MDEIEYMKVRNEMKFSGSYDPNADWNKHNGYIYIYVDLADNIVKYVGQTVNLPQRYCQHLSQKEFATRRWIVKYIAVDDYYLFSHEKDLRNKMLDIEYLFIKHFGTMEYFNSERTPMREKYKKYSYVLDKDLNKEFKVFIDESAKEEYSNLEFSSMAKEHFYNALPDLQIVADICAMKNVQNINNKLEAEYQSQLNALQNEISLLKDENTTLKQKISSVSKLLA